MRWRGIVLGLFLSSMAGTLSAQPPQGPDETTENGQRINRPEGRPQGRPEGRPEGRPQGRPEGRPEGRPQGRPEGRPDDRDSGDRRGGEAEWNRRGNQEGRGETNRPRMARNGQNGPKGPQGGPPIFALLDRDSNGRVSSKELKSFSKKLKAADRNDDGEVSMQELMSAVGRNPDEGPRNGPPSDYRRGPNGPGPNGPGPNGPGPNGPGPNGPGPNGPGPNGPGPNGPGNFGDHRPGGEQGGPHGPGQGGPQFGYRGGPEREPSMDDSDMPDRGRMNDAAGPNGPGGPRRPNRPMASRGPFGPNGSPMMLERMMKNDQNADGKLSREELPGDRADNILKNGDENQDGLLDREEIQKFFKEMSERRPKNSDD